MYVYMPRLAKQSIVKKYLNETVDGIFHIKQHIMLHLMKCIIKDLINSMLHSINQSLPNLLNAVLPLIKIIFI